MDVPDEQVVPNSSTISLRKRSAATLVLIYRHPVCGSIKWSDMETLFRELGAVLEAREGSRIGVSLFGVVRVFHRPHPSPDTDKGAVVSIRRWLEENGVRP